VGGTGQYLGLDTSIERAEAFSTQPPGPPQCENLGPPGPLSPPGLGPGPQRLARQGRTTGWPLGAIFFDPQAPPPWDPPAWPGPFRKPGHGKLYSGSGKLSFLGAGIVLENQFGFFWN
jgi:hypothetical protein